MLLLSCCSFFSNSLLRSSDYSSLSYSLEVSLVIYCFFSLFDKVSKKKNLDLQYTSHPHNLYLKLTLHFQIASDRSAMIPRRTKYLSPGTTLFYLFPLFFLSIRNSDDFVCVHVGDFRCEWGRSSPLPTGSPVTHQPRPFLFSDHK